MAKPSFSRKTSPLQQTVLAGLACWLALAGAFLHVRPVQAATLTITPAGDTLPAVVGEDWSQTYTVSGGDGNYTCSMDGTIPGLSFNAATLTLSGSPDDFGSYPVTISCTDGASPKNGGTYALNFRAEAPTQTTILTLRSDYPGGGYVAGYAIWVRADVSFNPAITGKQPTGTIVVTSGTGGPTCSDTLDANGEGECALIFPTSGTRTIQVSYTGATDVLASTASAAPITILPLDA
ncbi:MAG TPA: Ig-like domain-containing protein, partial [Anaerolineaceae bacterium]|nr:Ig-like domain-containing protein [Anaerolineaceae bacterium]